MTYTKDKKNTKKHRKIGDIISQFLLSAGLMAGDSDGYFSEEEKDCLAGSLSALFRDPRTKIDELSSGDQANQMLTESMRWLKDNAGEGRFVLYEQLAKIVAVDGVLENEEQSFMRGIAEGLAIPPETADDIIRDAVILAQR